MSGRLILIAAPITSSRETVCSTDSSEQLVSIPLTALLGLGRRTGLMLGMGGECGEGEERGGPVHTDVRIEPIRPIVIWDLGRACFTSYGSG